MIFRLVRQINSRHAFLIRFTGTKEKENQSHTNANEFNLWITLTTILCCVLEIILYFVYNRLVTFSNYTQIQKIQKLSG